MNCWDIFRIDWTHVPHRRRYNQSNEDQANRDNRMRWRHFKNVLQKECVELGDLPEYHQLWHRQKAHVGRFRVQPSHRRPTHRRKLQHSPFNFTRCRWDIANACPFVFAHFEHFAYFQAAPNAQAVANQHIQNQRIPPAFNEIRQ